MKKPILNAVAALALSASSAQAQGAGFAMEQLYYQCLEGKCLRAAGGIVRDLRRESDNQEFLNSQYGLVALAAFQAARKSDGRQNLVQVAAVLRGLARLSTQATQRATFAEVSREILRGNVEIFDQENPFVASPSSAPQNDARLRAAARREALVNRLRERRADLLKRLRERRERG